MKVPRFRFTGSSVVNVVGVLVIAYLVVALGQTVKRNYDLGRQISDLKQQMVLLQDQKDALAYNIQYYKTDSFQDRQARAKLGLQLPGENVIIIPHATPAATPSPSDEAAKPANKSNFRQWLDFIGGRS